MPEDIIRDIFLIRQRHPQLRIGQIIVNAAHMGGWQSDDVFYCPDDSIRLGLSKWLKEKSYK